MSLQNPTGRSSSPTVNVYRDGELLRTMTAQRAFYPDFRMASTRAAIHSTPVEDFYVIPSEILEGGSVGFRVFVNPLVWWMWIAGPVLLLGTVIALWPQRSPALAHLRDPAPRSAPQSANVSNVPGVSHASEAADQAGND